MKNCKFDTRGHIISYENDNGDTITDYKALGKAMGINQSSGSGDYDAPNVSHSGIGLPFHIPSNGILFISLLVTAFFMGILVLVAWILFSTGAAVAITIFFAVVLIGLGVLMLVG